MSIFYRLYITETLQQRGLKQANELAEELRNHIKYLETYASREINKGGAYDSEQEIQEVIEFEKQTLENMTKKIAQVEKAKI